MNPFDGLYHKEDGSRHFKDDGNSPVQGVNNYVKNHKNKNKKKSKHQKHHLTHTNSGEIDEEMKEFAKDAEQKADWAKKLKK